MVEEEMGLQRVAVVIPIYNEETNLPILFERLRDACDSIEGIEWHVIYINDGSRDRSAELLAEQHAADPRFRALHLSRNFGHQAAISAGLAYADADAVVMMDGDLQDPPEVIPDLVAAWHQGAQVVRAERRSRQETGFRRLGFELFHAGFGWISDFPLHTNTGIFCLLDRRAVSQLQQLSEQNRFIPGLRSWIGFRQEAVMYDRQARATGEPKQTLRRLVRYALDGLFSFSYKPLRLLTWMGVVISVFGFLLASYYITRRLTGVEHAVTGFTTLVTLLLFLGGIQLIGIGILGEYLGRVYDEVKRRPLFIVQEAQGFVLPHLALEPTKTTTPTNT